MLKMALTTLWSCAWSCCAAAGLAAEPPLKIGVLTDMSGAYSAFSGEGSVTAARMAAEDFGGSVLGRRIEILASDHQNRPDVASATTNRWFDLDGVRAVIDVPLSSAALAVQEIARNKKRIALFSTGITSELTGTACSPTGFQWTYDSYSMVKSLTESVVRSGGDRWFILVVDNAAGYALERDAKSFVAAAGGKVVGSVRHPLGSSDMASFLLQAQTAGANVLAFANAGQDVQNAIKQAREFGMTGLRFAPLVLFNTEVRALGLDVAQGLEFVTTHDWTRDAATRTWAKRFFAARRAMPSMAQAGVYSGVLHYLKAVAEAGTDDTDRVAATMRRLPVNDLFVVDGRVRPDGAMVHDMYLARVKTPVRSSGPWDDYEIVRTVPGDLAFRPLGEGGCPLTKDGH
ncbi:Leu/Ile/Val-binding protein [Methylobacterium frigidaeris]|uniref:Leu/Ile/Val-binding protein n=2 Tax=Methylobacterium frigidaeris TaxID=2038277 RepID=A0AA37HIA8_9HYPH|nr:Leu/Ile/Val-binding protein [Methylobacterium frigidaeris]